jgi:putative PIN family toxin of toxin-antitoxin system
MRVFLDTNVIVSAVTTRGLCADVLRTVLAEHNLITCQGVLKEVERVLRDKFGVPGDLASEYLELLSQDAVLAAASDIPRLRLTDQADIEIVAAAVAARSDVLVTGDREIQELKSVTGMRVASPRAFWDELTANKAL